MVPDDEDSRPGFDDGNGTSLQPGTDLAGEDVPSSDPPTQITTDISSVLEQDSIQEVNWILGKVLWFIFIIIWSENFSLVSNLFSFMWQQKEFVWNVLNQIILNHYSMTPDISNSSHSIHC